MKNKAMARMLMLSGLFGALDKTPEKKAKHVSTYTQCTHCGRNLFARSECGNGICGTCTYRLSKDN
jgi:hypothetical protein